MVMTGTEAVAAGQFLVERQDSERNELDVIRRYWTGKQPLPAIIPASAPSEVHEMARVARVNVIKIVVESITQSQIVDSIRAKDERDDATVDRAWAIWQANAMDRRQFGITRATTAYGSGYMIVLPGKPAPVMRPVPPRKLTALYNADDDLWPELGLERRQNGRGQATYRMYDAEAVYELVKAKDSDRVELAGKPMEHGAGVTPIVRYQDVEDLDLDDEPADALNVLTRRALSPRTCITAGQVAPLIELQDQINLTSFSLKAAEWYSAFRQRWVIGAKKLSAGQKMESAASQIWTWDEDPDRMRVGEFSQTELRGYIESRAEAMKFAATLSQTPVHELVGELVNLSAEALAAAEIGRDRMVEERKTGAGESHEQALRLAVEYEGLDLPDDVEMVWRDTSARAFGAVVDGLGKIAQMLQVPPQELWQKIPGATKQDVERWRAAFAEGDSITQMNALLVGQAGGGAGGQRESGIILPPGVRL